MRVLLFSRPIYTHTHTHTRNALIQENTSHMTKRERERERELKTWLMSHRFSPCLPEAIESIETDGAKLCDLVIHAKQLLENSDLKLDLLIQHFYYIAAQQR